MAEAEQVKMVPGSTSKLYAGSHHSRCMQSRQQNAHIIQYIPQLGLKKKPSEFWNDVLRTL